MLHNLDFKWSVPDSALLHVTETYYRNRWTLRTTWFTLDPLDFSNTTCILQEPPDPQDHPDLLDPLDSLISNTTCILREPPDPQDPLDSLIISNTTCILQEPPDRQDPPDQLDPLDSLEDKELLDCLEDLEEMDSPVDLVHLDLVEAQVGYTG